MNKINQYIDICLIDEYATKNAEGLSLDINDLPSNEISNFLDILMSDDSAVHDLVLDHMQKLINERLPDCEIKNRENNGLSLVRLSNGDSYLEKRPC